MGRWGGKDVERQGRQGGGGVTWGGGEVLPAKGRISEEGRSVDRGWAFGAGLGKQ